ncbi:hypothetical protein BD779DRAFT_1577751 [Infundibulicybe gibba]|nr:hypothetical protein BD779DRAFT_1577751 [Infundibulicybe gibba]
MSGLLSLPNELIIRIANESETCKIFRATFQKYGSRSRAVGGPGIETLDRSKIGRARVRVVELLPAALSALKGAENLIWNINGGDLDNALKSVFELLLPSQTITAPSGTPNPQPSHTPNLTKLTVRDYLDDSGWIAKIIGASPNLTHLDLWCSFCFFGEGTPTLHGVLSSVPHERPLRLRHLSVTGYCVQLCQDVLPHLRFLESLELRAVPYVKDGERSDYSEEEIAKSDRFSSSMGDIWKALEREGIRLTSVVAPVDDDLLRYISAADEFKKLSLLEVKIDTRAQNFFIHTLPRYAQTLVSLEILATHEGLWCFGDHNIDVIRQCTKLVELSVTVNTHGWQESMASIVTQIIDMTAALPNLHRLGLHPARPNELPGARYSGVEDKMHLRFVTLDLYESIAAFSPVDPAVHPPVITVVEDYVKRFSIGQCDDGSIKYIGGETASRADVLYK